jgi:uridine kinase
LVGVDGPDAAGKTTPADHLADALEVPTLRVSIDGFHQPRELRYQRGELSAEGYYHDSFDYPGPARRVPDTFPRRGCPSTGFRDDYR